MMNFVDSLKILGTELFQKPCLELNGKPTENTRGEVGVLGIDVTSTNHELYKCVEVEDGKYTWLPIEISQEDLDKKLESTTKIIDVIQLPEVGNEANLYRLIKGTLVEKQMRRTDCSCVVVETLPTPTGSYPAESIISAEDAQIILQGQTPTVFNVYYKVDDKAYCYIPAALGQAFGLPANWYDLTLIKQYVPALTYAGTITDITENDAKNGTFNILLEYPIYWYKDGAWTTVETIGMHGTGSDAVKFNSPTNIASGRASTAFGIDTQAIGSRSFAEGFETIARGLQAHAEGHHTEAGDAAHAEGQYTKATGEASHTEGHYTEATEPYSHAEGSESIASAAVSHAEGFKTHAKGYGSHTEGGLSYASGMYAHAEGHGTNAVAEFAHTEGYYTYANGKRSHAEGNETQASNFAAHAEGFETTASGEGAHSEGYGTTASGQGAHAEGYYTEAHGDHSHASGTHTIAANDSETVVGKYNDPQEDSLFTVGNGSNEGRSNAFIVKKDGTASIGAGPVDPSDVANKSYVDSTARAEVSKLGNAYKYTKSVTSLSPGWWTIAEASGPYGPAGYWTSLMHIRVDYDGRAVEDLLFTVELLERNNIPKIGILSNTYRNAKTVEAIRVVCDSPETTESTWTSPMLELKLLEEPELASTVCTFTFEQLFTSSDYEWHFQSPSLHKNVESEYGRSVYEFNLETTPVWADITRSTADINNLATEQDVDTLGNTVATISNTVDNIGSTVDTHDQVIANHEKALEGFTKGAAKEFDLLHMAYAWEHDAAQEVLAKADKIHCEGIIFEPDTYYDEYPKPPSPDFWCSLTFKVDYDQKTRELSNLVIDQDTNRHSDETIVSWTVTGLGGFRYYHSPITEDIEDTYYHNTSINLHIPLSIKYKDTANKISTVETTVNIWGYTETGDQQFSVVKAIALEAEPGAVKKALDNTIIAINNLDNKINDLHYQWSNLLSWDSDKEDFGAGELQSTFNKATKFSVALNLGYLGDGIPHGTIVSFDFIPNQLPITSSVAGTITNLTINEPYVISETTGSVTGTLYSPSWDGDAYLQINLHLDFGMTIVNRDDSSEYTISPGIDFFWEYDHNDDLDEGHIVVLSAYIEKLNNTVDNRLSATSQNPIENRVVTKALNNKLDANGWKTTEDGKLTWDLVADQGLSVIELTNEHVKFTGEDINDNGLYGYSYSTTYGERSIHHVADDRVNAQGFTYNFPEKSGTLAVTSDITEQLEEKQAKLPKNTSSSSIRTWVATNNALKDADGNKRPAHKIGGGSITLSNGTFPVKGSTLKGKFDDVIDINGFDLTNINLTSASNYEYGRIQKIGELLVLDDGAYRDYIEVEVSSNHKTLTAYWTYPYLLKRVSAETGSASSNSANSTSNNEKVGTTTSANFFEKWKRKEINSDCDYDTYASIYREYIVKEFVEAITGKTVTSKPSLPSTLKFKIGNVADNDEPFVETIAVRNLDGRLTVEDAEYDFQAINKRQLDQVHTELSTADVQLQANIDKVDTELQTAVNTLNGTITDTKTSLTSTINSTKSSLNTAINKVGTNTSTTISDLSTFTSGWWTLADTGASSGYWTAIMHIRVSFSGKATEDVTFIVELLEHSGIPKIGVLSHNYRNKRAFDAIRVICNRSSSTGVRPSIDIKLRDVPNGASKCTIYCEQVLAAPYHKWQFVNPVYSTEQTPSENRIEYVFDLTAVPVWSDITRSTADLNNLATKAYVDEKSASSDIILDTELSETSENGVQNKVLTATIKELQGQLAELLYKAPAISSFSASSYVVKKGTTPEITLSWSITKGTNDYTVTLDGSQVTGTSKTVTPTTTTTYTLKATDTKNTSKYVTKSTTVKFVDASYCGVSSDVITSIDTAKSALTEKLFTKTSDFSGNYDCNKEYIYMLIPKSFGTPSFKMGDFSGGFSLIASNTTYDLYRSNELQSSAIYVTVS